MCRAAGRADAGQLDAGFSDALPDVSIDAAPAIRHLGIEVNEPAGLDHGAEIDRVKAAAQARTFGR
jgi:hypothetical protein